MKTTLLISTSWHVKLKFIYLRPHNFTKSPPYLCLYVLQTKVRWRFRKILWPSQNIQTLTIIIQKYLSPLCQRKYIVYTILILQQIVIFRSFSKQQCPDFDEYNYLMPSHPLKLAIFDFCTLLLRNNLQSFFSLKSMGIMTKGRKKLLKRVIEVGSLT